MHIIVVSDRLSKSRTWTLAPMHLVLGLTGLAAVSITLAVGLLFLSLRHASDLGLPVLQPLVSAAQAEDARRAENYMRDNLNAMAVKLGQMQAQLVRLDALGERLATLAGIRPSEFRFNEAPARGGALPAHLPARALSMSEFEQQLERLSQRMENRADTLGILEAQLFNAKVKQKLMPTILPVETSWSASSFGWRIDPITGMQAMHEGVDFIAEKGMSIVAAAGGIVTIAEFHHQYGNLIEIDHGNDFSTRYAHASRMLVKAGDIVQRGVRIGEVGATGRTTGPHLHFEVRYKGVAQNPTRFLRASEGRSAAQVRAAVKSR